MREKELCTSIPGRCTLKGGAVRIPIKAGAISPFRPQIGDPSMKMRMMMIALTCFLLPALGAAQDARLKLPEFRSLAGKATESVNISLSPWLLHMAGAFIDDKDEDSAATKHLLAGIKSIQAPSYQFAGEKPFPPKNINWWQA